MSSEDLTDLFSAEEGRIVSVTIMGQEYPVRADVDAEYLKQLAVNLDQRMRVLHQTEPSRAPLKVAVLTALNLMDELATLRREHDQLAEIYESRARQMAEELTRRLVE